MQKLANNQTFSVAMGIRCSLQVYSWHYKNVDVDSVDLKYPTEDNESKCGGFIEEIPPDWEVISHL